MKQAKIFNIQRFSIHDGDGIRTTVFFKGCPLKCMWCHNPESLSAKADLMYDPSKCTLCGECVLHCKQEALSIKGDRIQRNKDLCTFSGDCVFYCVNQARQLVGKDYSIDDVYNKVIADKIFYEESGGGVTLSGGEPLVQIDFVEELAKRLYNDGIRVNIDTSGHVPFSNLERIAPYADAFLYDIKHTDRELFREYIGGDCDLVTENLKKLSKIHKNILLRMPIIVGVNCNEEHIQKTIALALECGIKEVYLLPYHDISGNKYTRLSKEYPHERMGVPTGDTLERFVEIFRNNGFSVHIGG